MKISIVILLASLLIAISGWGSAFQTWSDAASIGNVFSLLGVVGGVVLAWLGKSPVSSGK